MSTLTKDFGKITSNVFDNDSDYKKSAGYHNSIYRGKNITSYLTDGSLFGRINGTSPYSLFEDLFIGDYVVASSIEYVICHFDYYYRCSDSDISYHHAVFMPRGMMTGLSVTKTSAETTDGFYQWNESASTAGGYIASRMRTVIMPACDTKVKAAFGSAHVKIVSEIYPNSFASTTDGRAAGWAWTTTDLCCDLCNETMVCGHQVTSKGSTFENEKFEIGIDKTQLAIFALAPEFANIRSTWWLRSVSSAASVARVDPGGSADNNSAASAHGVRPRFLVS